eukprot:Gregarina_sp_Poly_1__1089@NODE_1266_length_4566_cov_27_360302_g861_i0_p1_GENE_NODE_1266_length_4566_cov_27_360302_g861_i0NODE_1266_length_4566_cov_27_360302_g861_i0_p1_ORF_typecomplete_len296_score45_22_NODE_1266_length_4566_cov_27_360302_g861_i011522039
MVMETVTIIVLVWIAHKAQNTFASLLAVWKAGGTGCERRRASNLHGEEDTDNFREQLERKNAKLQRGPPKHPGFRAAAKETELVAAPPAVPPESPQIAAEGLPSAHVVSRELPRAPPPLVTAEDRPLSPPPSVPAPMQPGPATTTPILNTQRPFIPLLKHIPSPARESPQGALSETFGSPRMIAVPIGSVKGVTADLMADGAGIVSPGRQTVPLSPSKPSRIVAQSPRMSPVTSSPRYSSYSSGSAVIRIDSEHDSGTQREHEYGMESSGEENPTALSPDLLSPREVDDETTPRP